MESRLTLYGRKSLLRLIAVMCAAALALTLLQAASVKADTAAGAVIYEAEDAVFPSSVSVMSDEPGYSGTGYVGRFEQSSDYITFEVQAPETALYDLSVGYGAIFGGGKVINVLLNGSPAGSVAIGQSGFGEVPAGKVLLNQGTNTITLTPNWTWFAIDYIKLAPTPEPIPHEVEKKLINPNATKEARALHSYLVDQFGEAILSGQQEYPNSNLIDTEYVYQTTGKYPAILGLDFIDNSPSRVERGTSADEVSVAIDWVNNRGGIVAFTWHWNAPKDLIDLPGKEWWRGFYTDSTNFDLAYALSHPESEDYQLLIRDMDVIAEELKRLQEADVPVLWRPLHEAEGGWFWWGAKGPQPVIELWRLMYDRMTNHHGLNNLIWVWNSIAEDWYPGDAYVDIVSFDSYPGAHNYAPMSAQFEELVQLSSNKKVIAMTENGPIPDPDLLQIYNAGYSWFTTWNGSILTEQNSTEHLVKVYNHDYVLTLDELPELATYLEDSQFAALSGLIDEYKTSGELSGPLAAQVANSFKQAEHHYAAGRTKQAAKHLEDLIKHLARGSSSNHVSAEAAKALREAAERLIQILK